MLRVKQKEASSSDTLHASQPLSAISPGEVIIGTVAGIDGQGQVLVNYHDNPLDKPLIAVSTLEISKKHLGRQVALLFTNGDLKQPVIMGLIHSPLQEMLESFEITPAQNEKPDHTQQSDPIVDEMKIDGKRVVLEAKEEIVLKCGDASITLTKAGKIMIRGKYLLNRSTGVNRIMGGSVQVN